MMIKKLFCTIAILFSVQAFAEGAPLPNISIKYKSQDGCSFMYGPVFYCDEKHLAEYSKAINSGKPNFFKDFVLVSILERPFYHQSSIAAVNIRTGNVYPVPIDLYSGTPGHGDRFGKLDFNLNGNKLCIKGDILVYRAIKTGVFCFYFSGDGFSGYKTTYMD